MGYIVTEEDLIKDLINFDVETAQKLIDNQIIQGNNPSIEVFQNSVLANKKEGGFDWNKSEEGYDFWVEKIIVMGKDKDADYYGPQDFQCIVDYEVKDEDLIGDLRFYTKDVVKLMLINQVNQGNKLDITIFQNNVTSNCDSGGFDWWSSEENFDFWNRLYTEKLKSENLQFKEENKKQKENLKKELYSFIENDEILEEEDKQKFFEVLNKFYGMGR